MTNVSCIPGRAKSEDLFTNTGVFWEQIQRFLKVRPIPLPRALPRANAGSGEANEVPVKIREQLKDTLSTTALGVKQRYEIDWGWS